MKIEVLFCGLNTKHTEGGFYSRIIYDMARLMGRPLTYVHVMLGIDTLDLPMGTYKIYELTMGGIYSCNIEEHDELDTIQDVISVELDKTLITDLNVVHGILDRIQAAELADLKGDWTDLLRIFLRKPLMNLTCVSFVRYALGFERDEDIVTADDLFEELIHEYGTTD